MTDDPVELDARRSPAGQIAAEIRRHSLHEFEADQETLRLRQAELEARLLAEPSASWPEAAVKAEYLIRRYAATAEAQHARRMKLIEGALSDLARLLELEKEQK